MAIRFLCTSCGEPIEVDDEWALKPVGCPYCRKSVTAPAESTFDPAQGVPTARKLASAEPAEQGLPYPVVLVPARDAKGTVAVIALALSATALALAFIMAMVLSAHKLELMEMTGNASAPSEIMKAQSEWIQQHGGVPPTWMVVVSLLMIGAGVTWLAAMICGTIGAFSEWRRRHAVLALVLGGLLPIVMCCSSALVGR